MKIINLFLGLSFLGNLAKVPDCANASSLLDGLSFSVWHRLVQLICLPDLAVVCASLEALRCLTNLGTSLCLVCWQSCLVYDKTDFAPLSLLKPLLALLTLEGQSMGSQSLHRIRVSLIYLFEFFFLINSCFLIFEDERFILLKCFTNW